MARSYDLSGGSSGAAYSDPGGSGWGWGGGGGWSEKEDPILAAKAVAQRAAVPPGVLVPGQVPQVIQTPYGAIATTNPQGQALLEQAAPNMLARERVFDPMQAAQNYRDLPANVALEEREAARQEYVEALNQSAEGRPPVSVSTAFGAPQRPLEDPAKIARYNAFLQDQGINPYTIGTAEMTEGGGLKVAPIQEEAKANFVANQAAREMGRLQTAERLAKKAAGKKGSGDAEKEAALEAQRKRLQYGVESGLIDPRNPMTAGMNVDNARRVALMNNRLSRDPNSLSSLAERQMREQPAAETEQQPVQQDLSDIVDRNRAQSELWAEELRRKQQMVLG